MNFKKYYILIIIIFTINSSTISQNRDFIVGSIIGLYGVHIEGEIMEVYSSSNGELSGPCGLSIGLNVKRNFSNNIFGAFELRYISKGSIFEFISNYGTPIYEVIRLNYIEIPILFGTKINLGKKYLLFETGLSYARWINSKMLVSDLKKWDTSGEISNFKENDISWIANLKYPIAKSEKLLLGLRFSYSLLSIHSVYKLYNMNYGIEFYYLFNRKIK
jgi:outer membrane protein with beta-barrel domain